MKYKHTWLIGGIWTMTSILHVVTYGFWAGIIVCLASVVIVTPTYQREQDKELICRLMRKGL